MNSNSTPKAFFSQPKLGASKRDAKAQRKKTPHLHIIYTSLKKSMNNEGLDLSLRHTKSLSQAAVVAVLCVLGGSLRSAYFWLRETAVFSSLHCLYEST
jgi:hypothetical protein